MTWPMSVVWVLEKNQQVKNSKIKHLLIEGSGDELRFFMKTVRIVLDPEG